MDYDYREFLGDVLLFRAVRDMDDNPGEWVDRFLSILRNNDDTSWDERRRLMLAAKFADLIDDYKDYLLEEIESDLTRASLPNEDSILC